MRLVRTYVAVFLSLVVTVSVVAQQPPTQTASSSPQALALLQRSLAALTGGNSITDVTLSGTARRIAGSDDESGTVVLRSLRTGESRMDLTLPSGHRSEIRANSPNSPVGAWSGNDGILHAISQHNLWTDSSWFFPAFLLSRTLGDSGYVVSYVGHETRNGQAVEHMSVTRHFEAVGAPPSWTPDTLQRLATMDLYLDAATLFPSSIFFKTHPDGNALLDILVEIRLSDYRPISSNQIPFRVQKLLNNSLAVDLEFQSVSVNSNLGSAAFAVPVELQ